MSRHKTRSRDLNRLRNLLACPPRLSKRRHAAELPRLDSRTMVTILQSMSPHHLALDEQSLPCFSQYHPHHLSIEARRWPAYRSNNSEG